VIVVNAISGVRLRSIVLTTALCLLASSPARAADVEVGTVEWRRDLDAALRESAASGKPVLAFFQEVPGCAGCRKFGDEVMSQPLIVDAIEHEFFPVLIYNNRRGEDAELLRRFDEPAWNYQVVRFLDGEARDLIPRKDRVWTVPALATRMIGALDAAGRSVPAYLRVAAYESDTARHASVAFSQYCFWTGEVELGKIEGVIETEAGFVGGGEVTLVRYHRGLISLEALVLEALQSGVADKVYVADEADLAALRDVGLLPVGVLDDAYRSAPPSDQKRQIRDSPLARLDLSPMQATKVNAFASRDGAQALDWLTPTQRARLEGAPREP
jgi:hypothetical protein